MNESSLVNKNFLISDEEYASFASLDGDKIGKIVSIAPTVIARAENRIASLEQMRFQLHQEYKREKARKILSARRLTGEDRLSNATDREAWALLQDSVIEALQKEIDCVTELKEAKVVLEFWKNQFIAARKLETRFTQERELEIQSARFIT